LQETDPVQPVKAGIVAVLREVVVSVHSSFAAIYNKEMELLNQNDSWQKIDARQKTDILRNEGIAEVPDLHVSDDTELLTSLNTVSIESWKTRSNALSQQFSNAIRAAVKLLEPKIQNLKIPAVTIKNESDLEAWLTEAKQKILKCLQDGPVMLS
jgi:hypothetical protein